MVRRFMDMIAKVGRKSYFLMGQKQQLVQCIIKKMNMFFLYLLKFNIRDTKATIQIGNIEGKRRTKNQATISTQENVIQMEFRL